MSLLPQYDNIIYDIITSHRPVESSVVGNLVKFISSKFPKDYFNENNISTSTTIERETDEDHTNLRLNKFPSFNIEVSPSLQQSEYSIGTEWYRNHHLKLDYNTKLMEDWEGYKFIRAGIDRSVISVNVQILESSEFRGIETAKYLTRSLPFGRTTFLNDCVIGFILPNQLIQTIANSIEVDLTDPNHLEWFKTYLYNSSGGSIRYSLDSASGNHSFIFHYKTKIVMTITSDLPNLSVERTNKTNKHSEITFEVKLDLPTIPTLKYYQESTLDKGSDLTEYVGTDEHWKGYISMPVLALPPKQLKYSEVEGEDPNKFLQLSYYISLVTGEEYDGTEDTTPLSDVVPDYILNKWTELPVEKRKAMLWFGNDEVPSDDFYVDDNLNLTIRMPSLRRNWQYRLALYVDSEYFTKQEWEKLENSTPFT